MGAIPKAALPPVPNANADQAAGAQAVSTSDPPPPRHGSRGVEGEVIAPEITSQPEPVTLSVAEPVSLAEPETGKGCVSTSTGLDNTVPYWCRESPPTL